MAALLVKRPADAGRENGRMHEDQSLASKGETRRRLRRKRNVRLVHEHFEAVIPVASLTKRRRL